MCVKNRPFLSKSALSVSCLPSRLLKLHKETHKPALVLSLCLINRLAHTSRNTENTMNTQISKAIYTQTTKSSFMRLFIFPRVIGLKKTYYSYSAYSFRTGTGLNRNTLIFSSVFIVFFFRAKHALRNTMNTIAILQRIHRGSFRPG